jgi:hypothetical protein
MPLPESARRSHGWKSIGGEKSSRFAHVTRAVTVPPAVRSVFVAALAPNSPHAAALPDPLPMGRVLRVVDKASNSTDELKVLAGQNDKGYFLDYFRVDNGGETNWHARILQDGTLEELENYDGQFGFPYFPDDPAKTAAEEKRILEHNTRVREILVAKGFE